MGFNNLNYSTEAQIDEDSIQDKIDTQRLEIKEITKENLKNLKVDILNGNSSLRIRDAEGKVIGKLKDNQIVDFNGEKKLVNHGDSKKLFLGIDLKNGLKGFISADYVKGKLEIKEPVIQTTTPVIVKDKQEVIPADKATDNKNSVLKAKESIIQTTTPVIVKDKQEVVPADKATDNKNSVLKASEKINTLKIKELIINDLNNQFRIFKETAESVDLIIQSSKEKKANKDFLNRNYNALIILIDQAKDSTDPEIKKITEEIKFYLAEYYADEGNIDNDSFNNYKLSNSLALSVLGEIDGLPAPKAPDNQDIISSFKGTGVGTYIISKLNDGEEISEVFSSSIVKNASKEEGKKLIKQYNNDLDEYLEKIDSEHRSELTDIQKKSLDLLMDVNGTGWFNVKNSTTDIWDVMGWDFASIGAGIGTGFGAGALAGSWTGAGALVTGGIGAIVGGTVTTAGMMINHGDDYFSDDWKKGLTELGINTATFGVGGTVFKIARGIQGTGHILKSGRGLTALGVEASTDVFLGATADLTRAWSNDINIELSDAVINNLAWALLPIAMNGKQMFSPSRWKLAEQVVSDQQKATLLYRLGDTIGSKKVIETTSLKIKEAIKKDYTLKSPEIIGSLNNKDRRIAAGQYLNKNVSDEEFSYIMLAHNEADLGLKVTRLKEAGFDKQSRRVLLESGVCGKVNYLDKIKTTELKFIRDIRTHFKSNSEMSIKIGGEEVVIQQIGLKYKIKGTNKKLTGKELFDEINKKVDSEINTPKGKKMEKEISSHINDLKNNKTPLKNVFSAKFWRELEGGFKDKVKDASLISRALFRLKNITLGEYIRELDKSIIEGKSYKKLIGLRTIITGKHSTKVWKESGGRPEVFSPSTRIPTAWLPRREVLIASGIFSGIEVGANWNERTGKEHLEEAFKTTLTLNVLGVGGEILMDFPDIWDAGVDFLGIVAEEGKMIADS